MRTYVTSCDSNKTRCERVKKIRQIYYSVQTGQLLRTIHVKLIHKLYSVHTKKTKQMNAHIFSNYKFSSLPKAKAKP